MDIKKMRNFIIVIGVMVALLPWFLFFIQKEYYGPGFSMITTTVAIVAFIIASLIQAYDNKKRGVPVLTPLLIVCGFCALLIYIIFFF